KAGIGYLPQEASIFRKLTVYENILGILQTRKDLNNKQREDKANQLLEEFHIQHIRESHGMALSGGERRRVEIARALAMEPDFILLDEPFAGVDPISVSDIKHIVRQVRDRNIGVLITDHNVRETLDICEQAYIVGNGHIIASGSPEDVLKNEKVREVYLGDEFTI
ncbi:ABC transporter ATP-binding protein, partial [Oleiphilus sp. HI0122]